VTLLPIVPIITPLAGALLCATVRFSETGGFTRRLAYATFVALTAISVAVLRGFGPDATVQLPPASHVDLPAMPLWSPLAYWAASLLLGVLFVGQLADHDRPLSAVRAAHYLVVLAATMAVISAGNSVSLVIAWSIPSWLVLYLRVAHSEGSQRVSRWDTWAGFISTALVILGATAGSAEQEGSLFLIELAPRLAFYAFALAAGTRLLLWPLAGGRGRWWQLHAMSLVSGLFLWIRIGIALDATGPLVRAPFLAAIVFMALGLAIGPREGQSRVVPFSFGYWLALIVLAPLLDPERGFAVSLLIGTQLLLCLVLLRGEIAPSSGPWLPRLPGLVAFAALSGLVMTSGFAAHWVFGQICFDVSGYGLLAVAAVAYLLAAVPLWRRLSSAVMSPAREPGHVGAGASAYILAAIAGGLVLLGVWPGVLLRIWPDIRVGLESLGYRELWGNDLGNRLGLIAATVLAPASTGLFGQRLQPAVEQFYGRVDRAGQSARGEWLYLVAQRIAARGTGAMRAALEALEESLPLVWCLVWCIALVYYLLQM